MKTSLAPTALLAAILLFPFFATTALIFRKCSKSSRLAQPHWRFAAGTPLTCAPILIPHWISNWLLPAPIARLTRFADIYFLAATAALPPSLHSLCAHTEPFLFGNFEFPRHRLLDPEKERIRKTMNPPSNLRFIFREVALSTLSSYHSVIDDMQISDILAGCPDPANPSMSIGTQPWLKKELRLEIAIKEVYRHLGKLGARLKVVSAVRRRAAAAISKKTPRPRRPSAKAGLRKSSLRWRSPAGRVVRVWVSDKVRFGLHTVHRRMWGLRGVRVVVPHQQKDEWDYTYGAVEVTRAGSVFCFQITVHQESSQWFLERISADDPAAIHVVIEDGAGFHLCEGDARVPANVRLIQLPAYCPELNPVEKLWDHLQDAVCNQVRPGIEALRAALHRWLEAFWRDESRAFSLIGRGWLVNVGGKN